MAEPPDAQPPQPQPERLALPAEVLSGEGSYVTKAGRVLTPSEAKRLANLRPFQPGQTANPRGRPKGSTVTEFIRQKLSGRVRDLFDKETLKKGTAGMSRRVLNKQVADAIADVSIKQALKGNYAFLQLVLNRNEGAVPQRLAGHDGGPLPGGMTQEQLARMMADPKAMAAARELGNFLAPDEGEPPVSPGESGEHRTDGPDEPTAR